MNTNSIIYKKRQQNGKNNSEKNIGTKPKD